MPKARAKPRKVRFEFNIKSPVKQILQMPRMSPFTACDRRCLTPHGAHRRSWVLQKNLTQLTAQSSNFKSDDPYHKRLPLRAHPRFGRAASGRVRQRSPGCYIGAMKAHLRCQRSIRVARSRAFEPYK